MSFVKTEELLKRYGIKLIRSEVAKSKEQAVNAAKRIGFPVALKVISREIVHKSDMGCVKLNLNTCDEVRGAFDEIMRNAKGYSIDGVLVQKMAGKGIELIIGGKRDPQFGELILLGIGGILVELFRDFSVRICPITKQHAYEMMDELKGAKLLRGYRGLRADREAIAGLLVKTSRMLVKERIKELDFNPVIAYPKGYDIVDVRVVL